MSRRLLIVSNMPHYQQDGGIVGFGPTAREIDHLAQVFDEIRHVAPLHPGPAPQSARPYASSKVVLVPQTPSGGPGFRHKLGILRRTPSYLAAISRELRRADVIHVRAPASLPLVTMVWLALRRRREIRWIKYGGAWGDRDQRSRSAALQRWWLRRNLSRSWVTVNGTWPGQKPHVVTFPNPCFTREELVEARDQVQGKTLRTPVRLIFVGRLEPEKGLDVALEAFRRLVEEHQVDAVFDLVGGGPQSDRYRSRVEELGLSRQVRFHGWTPHEEVGKLYRPAHFLLFPSQTEGWPKVVSEAMARGVVPLTSDVSCLGQMLGDIGTGRAFPVGRPGPFADAVLSYIYEPDLWPREHRIAMDSAAQFTFEAYLEHVYRLLDRPLDGPEA